MPEESVRALVVIGASAGGRTVIGTVLKNLSADIPAAIVVMLHTAPDSAYDLSAWFRQLGHIEVVQASENQRLREGVVFVPSPGHAGHRSG